MKIYTEMNINRIYLFMGLSCNMNCKYCYEKFLKHSQQEISDKLIQYLKYLPTIKPFAKDNPIKLLFWGGEPLLYLDIIKRVVSELGDLPYKFATVSNGTLFTESVVDYFNQHKIGVSISNDGVNTNLTRKINILDNDKQVNIIKRLDDFAIDSVVSAYNYDYVRTCNYIYSKFQKEVSIAFEWLHCDKNTPRDLYSINYTNYEKCIENYLQIIEKDIRSNYYSSRVDEMLPDINAVLKADRQPVNLSPRCGQMRGSFNLDLQGNVMACHPAGILGDINSDYRDMLELYDKRYNQAFSFADCGTCEYLRVCRGGCPLELPCEGKIAICKAKKIYYRKIKELFSK